MRVSPLANLFTPFWRIVDWSPRRIFQSAYSGTALPLVRATHIPITFLFWQLLSLKCKHYRPPVPLAQHLSYWHHFPTAYCRCHGRSECLRTSAPNGHVSEPWQTVPFRWKIAVSTVFASALRMRRLRKWIQFLWDCTSIRCSISELHCRTSRRYLSDRKDRCASGVRFVAPAESKIGLIFTHTTFAITR